MRIYNNLKSIDGNNEIYAIAANSKAIELIAKDASGNLNSKLFFMNSMIGGQGDQVVGMPCSALEGGNS